MSGLQTVGLLLAMTPQTAHPTPAHPTPARAHPTPVRAHPTPVGPFGLGGQGAGTEPIEPVGTEVGLDALPLLDHRVRSRTISPELALRGAYLTLHDGQEARLLRLEQDNTHLGRGAGAEVRFDDHRVSRDHAILIRHGRHVRLLDNRSVNGTYVNGRQIIATNLSGGDLIELGPVRLEFLEVA
jgi:hypothetical protein